MSKSQSSSIASSLTYGALCFLVLVAGMAFLSWFVDSPSLRGIASLTQLQMKANTALGFLLSAFSLFLLYTADENSVWRRRLGLGLAALVTGLGTVTLAEYLLSINFGIDELLVQDPLGSPPGRMVPASAINFILKGLALLTLDWETKHGHRPAQVLAVISMVAPMQVLFALVHGTEAFIRVGSYPYITQMSPNTAIAWLMLSIGTLCARPGAGFMKTVFHPGNTGRWVRWGLVGSIGVPLLLSYLTNTGSALDGYHPGFGASIFVLLTTMILTYFTWRAGRNILAYEDCLSEKSAALERSNRALEEFARIASHDMKSPLHSIHLNLEILNRKFAIPADGQSLLKAASGTILRLSDLIDSILSYSVSNQNDQIREKVELAKVVQSSINNLRADLNFVNPRIEMSELPVISGDASRLTQLFQNLIANAMKYRSDEPCHIEIRKEVHGADWLLSVRDNGIGFQESEREKIFVPFYRIHRDGVRPGSGLGLATCKQIVEQHGGKIWADANANQGSIIYFTLPRLEL